MTWSYSELGIKKLKEIIPNISNKTVVARTDSKTAILQLSKANTKNKTVLKIQRTVKSLAENNVLTRLEWVARNNQRLKKAHDTIRNEHVALTETEFTNKKELKKQIHKQKLEHWQNLWDN